jgi:hypothetical protein
MDAFERHFQCFAVWRYFKCGGPVNQLLIHELLQAHREVLHSLLGANPDGVGQLGVLPFQHELANDRGEHHDLDRRHASHPRSDRGEQFLSHDGFHVEGNRAADGSVEFLREQVQNAPDGRRRRRSVYGTEHQMTRLSGVNRRHERLLVTHFADQHDIGILPHRVLHPHGEIDDVLAHLALVDQTLVLGVDELDRILQRQDVLAVVRIDPVEHRRNRGRLARASHTCQQDHSLVVLAEVFHDRRQMQPGKVGNPVADASSHQTDLAHLGQHVDTEPPHLAVVIDRIGKVGAALLVKDRSMPLVHHRKQQPTHLLHVDRSAVELLELAVDAHDRRLANLHVQVTALQLHTCAKILVDLQLLFLGQKAIL